MSAWRALVARELKAFWCSPIAYVVGGLFLLMQGWVFGLILAVMNDPRVDPSFTMAQFFFGGSLFFWFSVFLMTALLTMRTFSEEKRVGTIELLLTAPVSDTQVVLAKFAGAWLAYILLWLVAVGLFGLLRLVTPFEWGPVLTGFLGTCLLGGLFTALGVLASSLTRNQVIAAVLTFVASILLFSVGILDIFVHDPEASELIRYFSVMEHIRDFGRGIVDTRPVVLYASLAAVALFLTGRVIASPRWRS